MKGLVEIPNKCVKCGNKVCRKRAMFYTYPLNQLCVDCRKAELNKHMEEDTYEK